MATINEMYKAVEAKTAKVLTIDLANELKGKRIATIYFGYKGQDGFDEFVVGEVKPEIYATGKEGKICLFTAEGRNTYIRAHEENEGAFTCSDSDRFVFYVEVKTQALKVVSISNETCKEIPSYFNCDLETAKSKNEWLANRKIVSVESVEIDIAKNEYFDQNGMLRANDNDVKPIDNDAREWRESYQINTGNTLPKGVTFP